jgi:signal peptidase I
VSDAEEGEAGEGRRPLPARIGIVLLNLLGPGLGLLRVQRLRAAIVLLLLPHVLIGLVILVFALSPVLGFWIWMALVGTALAILLVAYCVAMGLSWRASRLVRPPGLWWSRWYGILLIALANFGANWMESDIVRCFYRPFYVPSESMLPTLRVNDGFLASMRAPDPLRRGDLILFETRSGALYNMRIAALPGDQIAVVDGIVHLNGHPVAQRLVATEPVSREEEVRYGAATVRRLAEQFPGESAPHEIYDRGNSLGDEFPDIRIPAGHVFVLGDNRDNAADSRFQSGEMGAGLVPIERVRGQPLYHSWRSSRPMGTPVNHSR